jgi:hypothetical protein
MDLPVLKSTVVWNCLSPSHLQPRLVGQTVSSATQRWTTASALPSTPAVLRPDFPQYMPRCVPIGAMFAGNDRKTHPAKNAGQSGPVSDWPLSQSILSAISSALGSALEGESANARGSALQPRRAGDKSVSRNPPRRWRERPDEQLADPPARAAPKFAGPRRDPPPRRHGRQSSARGNPP